PGFVNRSADAGITVEDLVRDPVETVDAFDDIPHPRIPLPVDLYRSFGIDRSNSMGVNLANDDALRALATQVEAPTRADRRAPPPVPGGTSAAAGRGV